MLRQAETALISLTFRDPECKILFLEPSAGRFSGPPEMGTASKFPFSYLFNLNALSPKLFF